MTGYEGETQRLQPPCPLCGGTAFTWGHVEAPRGQPVLLMPDSASFWQRTVSSGGRVQARVCSTCANMQLFVESRPEE